MSKKRKCKLCKESMSWSLPERVTDKNIDYAKHCLAVAKGSIVCGYTMKTKTIDHEQYCKHYKEKRAEEIERDSQYDEARIRELEQMIEEYERWAFQNQQKEGS